MENFVHHFDAVDGVYLGSDPAFIDPKAGSAVAPAQSTLIAPPETPAGSVAVWNGKAWEVVLDKRGTEYWLADGSHHVIDQLGEDLPEGALDAAPPKPREQQLAEALAKIDTIHAQILVAATGGASVPERDTWTTKAAAARAYQAGTATALETAMLTEEAVARGLTVEEHVSGVTEKANAFTVLIGHAGALSAAAKVAAKAACAESVPLEDVAAGIEAAIAEMIAASQPNLT